MDALCWRRLCTSYKTASDDLCHSIALSARRLCTSLLDPSITSPLLACRLIALNKNPGVRPIGIGETPRKIIAKAITRADIQEVTRAIQLCADQISGTEAAVHTAQEIFHHDSLNRLTALHNITRLCPSLATVLIITYRAPTELFVDGDVLYSREGATQGDPLAMPMYALAIMPLVRKLQSCSGDVTQIWYADDAAAAGKLIGLHE